MSASSRHRDAVLSKSLAGRQSAERRPGAASVLFRPITLISLLLIGLFAFGALIVLSGFAKDLRKAPPGQATPRSVSAVGYQALTDYLAELNFDVAETRGDRDYYDRENRLVVYTPSSPYSRLKRTMKDTGDEVRLIVLPKWSVGQMVPQKGESGRNDWARKTSESGLYSAGTYQSMMDDMPVVRRHDEPSVDAQVFFNTPNERSLPPKLSPDFKDLQYFDLNAFWTDYQTELRVLREARAEARRREIAEAEGREYEPKSAEDESDESDDESSETESENKTKTLPNHETLLKIDDKVVLIRLENTETYILSEPDFVNTMAFQTQSGAHLAGAILNEVIGVSGLEWQVVDFDVSLHGIESNRNIIKLMVTPPFLAATLCLLAAGGLVAWQGFNRFGDPARVRPDYAQGPVSLARTAAEFMEIAGRAHGTGEAYAGLIRRQVAETLGFGTRSTEHTDTLLNAREKRLKLQPNFAHLKQAIAGADPQSYPQYARALTQWRDAMTAADITPTDTTHKDLGQEDLSL
jgi:hypothetical protein